MDSTNSSSKRTEVSRVQLDRERLAGMIVVYRQHEIQDRNGKGLKELLDRCYPNPPRDVFERMLGLYKPGDPLYTVEYDGQVVSMVYCARHSKGGHLENLAVDPDYRSLGIADRLVETLMRDNPDVITLTTRIPAYFERFGFKAVEQLMDESVFMAAISPASTVTSTNTETASRYHEL